MERVETLNEARGKLVRKAGQLKARNARGRSLPALILMTDDMRPADWLEAARALPRGSAVIVRHRDPHAREALARGLRSVCAARRIKMLIADDAALAVRVRADGVHVPERRVARIAALRAHHPRWFVTTSGHGARSAGALLGGADAVLIAPVFATASHANRHALGVLGFGLATARTRLPVYALGGVDAVTVQRLGGLLVAGVAMIGGWVVSPGQHPQV